MRSEATRRWRRSASARGRRVRPRPRWTGGTGCSASDLDRLVAGLASPERREEAVSRTRLPPSGCRRAARCWIADLVEPQHPSPRNAGRPIGGMRSRGEQAEAMGAPDTSFSGFVDERWNSLPLSRRGGSAVAALDAPPRLAATRRTSPPWTVSGWCGHAVFGGFRPAGASAPRLPAGS